MKIKKIMVQTISIDNFLESCQCVSLVDVPPIADLLLTTYDL